MLFLGIDGGGTKTDFVLGDEAGNILATQKFGSASHWQFGGDRLAGILEEGFWGVLKKAGKKASDVVSIGFGMSGYGEDSSKDQVSTKICEDFFGDIPIRICNDSEVGLIASLGYDPGINVVNGTGSMAVGRDNRGIVDRAGGWGHEIGDEGSGNWLGMRLLEMFAKQSDGRIEQTMLHEYVREQFHIQKDFELITLFHNEYYQNRSKVASLQKILCDLAKMGDPCALALYDQSATEAVMLAKALRSRMEFTDPVMVSYSGGVFGGGDFIREPFKRKLTEQGFVFSEPRFKPIQGTVIMAAKQVGLHDELMKKFARTHESQ